MTTRKQWRWGLALAAMSCLGLLAGCSSLDVHVDHDTYTDFSRFRTYAWAEKDEEAAVDPRVDNDLLAARVRRAVDTELRKAGYELVDPDQDPDFWVTYQSVVDKKLDARTYYSDFPSYRYGPSVGYGYGSIREVALGTLMVDILDGEDQKLVWRGSAQARLHEDWSPEERTEHVNRAVSEILERFPPEG